MASSVSWVGVVLLFSLSALLVDASSFDRQYSNKAYVVVDNDQLKVTRTFSHSAVAFGYFDDKIESDGWAYLDIHTSGTYSNKLQACAAGMVEGFLSSKRIFQQYENSWSNHNVSNAIQTFLSQNQEFMKQKIVEYSGSSPPDKEGIAYWEQVDLLQDQLLGLSEGYHLNCLHFNGCYALNSTILPNFSFLLLQIGGDLEDLDVALQNRTTSNLDFTDMKSGRGSCSALIKLLADKSDVLIAQDTWSSYVNLLKVIKRYSFNIHLNGKVIPTASFSSYPGKLTSGDDFYIMKSGLITLETTIGNANMTLYNAVQPNSVLEWIRSTLANRLATSGKEWADLFSQYNSGTYNNQWMVVDVNKFKSAEKKMLPGFLYVVEQIPSLIVAEDQTSYLESNLYFGSYNTAFYPEVRKLSGSDEAVKKFGPWFSYDGSPRALIFKRETPKIDDAKDRLRAFKSLMRLNDYKNDPYARCNCTPSYSAENGIAARSDLNPINGTYAFAALSHRLHGATDSKVTSALLSGHNLESPIFFAIAGPSTSDGQLPPFVWSQSDFKDTPHQGHPDAFNFSWQRIQFPPAHHHPKRENL